MLCFTAHIPGLLRQLGRPRSTPRLLPPVPTSQVQALLNTLLPPYLLSPAEDGPHSRTRCFTFARTFIGFLWQVLNPGASCLQALRQIQACAQFEGENVSLSDDTSAYCQARQRLPLERIEQIFRHTVRSAEERVPLEQLWKGHSVKIIDGTGLSMPDTPANQALYPQEAQQKPGCGFPILRMVALASFSSGAILDFTTYSQRSHDIQLFNELRPHLRRDDIILGDRGFCSYAQIALLQSAEVHAVFRLHQGRPGNGKRSRLERIKSLGRGDQLVQWKRTYSNPKYMSEEDLAQLPNTVTVRIIHIRVTAPGIRTRKIIIVTTLLDPIAYPAAEIAALYLQRWRVELVFRDLKTTMQMDILRCKKPEMIQKEILMHFIAHNLIRLLMQEGAIVWFVPLQRLSFKGALDTFRESITAMGCNRGRKSIRAVYTRLIASIAAATNPERPGRREPRATKRRPKNHQWLTSPRHLFKEYRHRGKYPNRRWA